MENFTLWQNTKLIFGKDTENIVGEETKNHAKKVLLHYGQSHIKKTGLYDKVVDSLNKAEVKFVELSGVMPNPRLELVREGIELCRKENIELILAVGGGSVIDSAKAIAAGYYYQEDVWDLFLKGIWIKKALPVATILTIPAAGSELSPSSVISNMETNRKLFISGECLRPVFSILNPELTKTLPKWHTAAGVVDMMSHIFERYFTNTKNVYLTDELCEAVLRSIIKNGKLVMKNPDNYDYRAEIMWAGTIAHGGLLGTGREEDWATHRIEHELSAYYDVTHGAGLAVIFPNWMKYVYKQDVQRFIRFANKIWNIEGNDEETALKGIEATKQFFKSIGMPITLKELKIDDKKLELMAKQCTVNGPLGSFVKLDASDVLEICKLALE